MKIHLSSYDEKKLKNIHRIFKQKLKNMYCPTIEQYIELLQESFDCNYFFSTNKSFRKIDGYHYCKICSVLCKESTFRQLSCNCVFHKKCIDNLAISCNILICPFCNT